MTNQNIEIGRIKNEMDLFSLWSILIRWKMVVAGVALVTFAAIISNSFLSTSAPIYKVTSILSMPSEGDIKGLRGYIPKKVFNYFVNILKSREVRWRYFELNRLLHKFALVYEPNAESIFEEKFNKMLSVHSRGDSVIVSFISDNPKLAVELTNDFVIYASEVSSHELIQNITVDWDDQQNDLIDKIDSLLDEISAKRKEVNKKREDKLIQLKEMLFIAEQAGINDTVLTSMPNCKIGAPYYMMGSKALRAEIKALGMRNNNDSFIREIRGWQSEVEVLQSKLSKLKSSFPDFSHINSMKIVHIATVPNKPINKPEFEWIILTGIMSGLVLGILAALFFDFVVRARGTQSV